MRNAVDLLEEYSGDLVLEGGDLADTSEKTSLTYYQILRMLLNSGKMENLIYPDLGIELGHFYGRANSREVGIEMARIIKQTISETTTLYQSELEVTPFPVSKNKIAFQIRISTLADSENRLVIAYDTQDSKLLAMNLDHGKDISILTMMPPTINSREI